MMNSAQDDIFRKLIVSSATVTSDILMGRAMLYFFTSLCVSLSLFLSERAASEPRLVCDAAGTSSATARAERIATAQGTWKVKIQSRDGYDMIWYDRSWESSELASTELNCNWLHRCIVANLLRLVRHLRFLLQTDARLGLHLAQWKCMLLHNFEIVKASADSKCWCSFQARKKAAVVGSHLAIVHAIIYRMHLFCSLDFWSRIVQTQIQTPCPETAVSSNCVGT